MKNRLLLGVLLTLGAVIGGGLVAFTGIHYTSAMSVMYEEYGKEPTVVASVPHFSAIPGKHEYHLLIPGQSGSPHGYATTVWMGAASSTGFDDTNLVASQACGATLRFNDAGALTGIGLYDESSNEFGQVQGFAPVALKRGQAYELIDAAYINGFTCVFKNVSATGVPDIWFAESGMHGGEEL